MGRIEIRDFDGNLEALSAMSRDSWLEEYGQDTWPDLYQPKLTRHFFADVPDPRFLIGAYDGAELVAFVANLPRNYRFNGEIYKGVASCMMVARKEYRGAAVYLIAECLRRNQEFGADFALMTLEKKHRSWLMFEEYLKPRSRIKVIKKLHTIVHPVDFESIVESENLKWHEATAIRLFGAHRPIMAPSVSGAVRSYGDADLIEILALIGRYSNPNSLIRIFDAESLARRLDTEDVTSTVVYERDGAVEGFINFTIYDMVCKRGTRRWAWLDFLYWEGLNGREKKALLAGLWKASRDQGCVGILEWSKNYYAKGPLFRSRFFPYPRFLELNAWILNPALSLRGVDNVFEQVI
jgi:hypothetical protein